MWDLIVSVPDHCLSFYFEGRMWDLIVSVPDQCLSFYSAYLSQVLWDGGTNVWSNGVGHMANMATIPIYTRQKF